LNPVPRCYGPEFENRRSLLAESQWWDAAKLQQYQNGQLAQLIEHCYNNVPYYRDLFRRLGLIPGDIRSQSDLSKLPLLDKDTIRANFKALQARNISPRRTELHTTGGTTGTPLALVLSQRTDALRLAFEWRYYNWAGYHFGDPIAVFRGRQVHGFERGKRWEFDPHENHLVFCAFDMNDQNLAAYIQKLQEFNPKFIRGYPSNLTLLARFGRERGVDLNFGGSLQGLLTSSETLYPHQREEIEKAFGAPVSDLYGNTEQAGRLGQCELRDGYHDFVEHSVVEVLDPDQAGVGEMIATSLINYTMPLLRYRTGDMVQLSDRLCRCGRGLRLISKLQGRKQDIALLANGTPLSLTAFFFAVHVPEMAQVKKIQFQQEIPGRLKALVVKGQDYQDGACERMLKRMNQNLAVPFEIQIHYLDDIPPTKGGKHQFFVSTNANGH
jgi:phenylacetate-CoA ligase